MVLADFLNRHAGETAWLFGKGPSFSDFDFKTAGPLRVAINDVIAHVPDCKYGFSNDGVRLWANAYQPGQILFQPARCLHEYDSRIAGAVACEVVTYADKSDDTRLALPREEIAKLPCIRRGTLGSALQILHVMGIKTVYMVGIDGGGEHASGREWKTRLRNDHAKYYNAIRNGAIDAAHIMGLSLIFHNRDNDMEPNGKVFVRFKRNACAQSEAYSEGEIASFNPRVAGELVSCRAAEFWTPPAKQPEPPHREAAAFNTPIQTATLPLATKKTRQK